MSEQQQLLCTDDSQSVRFIKQIFFIKRIFTFATLTNLKGTGKLSEASSGKGSKRVCSKMNTATFFSSLVYECVKNQRKMAFLQHTEGKTLSHFLFACVCVS